MSGLNETNNESYRYLRSVGNTWQFNVEDLHPKMITRLYKRFDTVDRDNDGKMEMDEIMCWPERMIQLVNATDEQIEKIRTACHTFFFSNGVDPVNGLPRENWIECNSVFAEAERERERQGEPVLIAMLSDAFFDVLDNDDGGTVGVDRLIKTMMKAFDVSQEATYIFFEKADTDRSGALERPQLVQLFRKFWMEPYDHQLDLNGV